MRYPYKLNIKLTKVQNIGLMSNLLLIGQKS